VSAGSFDTTIELTVNGHACEREVTVRYEYSPAGGDGWHEPRYPEGATVCEVECWHEGADKLTRSVDLLPLLTKEVIDSLESDCCANEAAEREFRASEHADLMREEMRA
jgi:hypothetical protein